MRNDCAYRVAVRRHVGTDWLHWGAGLGLTGSQLSELGPEPLRGGFLAGEDAMTLVDGDAGVDRGRRVTGLAARGGRRRRRFRGPGRGDGRFAGVLARRRRSRGGSVGAVAVRGRESEVAAHHAGGEQAKVENDPHKRFLLTILIPPAGNRRNRRSLPARGRCRGTASATPARRRAA